MAKRATLQDRISGSLDDPRLILDRHFLDDLTYWIEERPKTALIIMKLIESIRRDPFTGAGSPERLKHFGDDVNAWSRHITQEHRLVYVVEEDGSIYFVQCRYHY
jgi:toxin YoeB